MNTAYLLLGSNLGDRNTYLERARKELETKAGTIFAISKIYNTAAWPEGSNQQDFLNQAIGLHTPLLAPELLHAILTIEKQSGRTRNGKWEARIIDIDLLFYNSDIIKTTDLSVPHPHLHERRFVLVPLAEIAPDFIHPGLQKSVGKLLAENTDKLTVTPVFK